MYNIRATLFFIAVMLTIPPIVEAKELSGNYTAEVVRILDGDTIEVDIIIWIDLTKRIKLRLAGVNTPEKRGKGITDC